MIYGSYEITLSIETAPKNYFSAKYLAAMPTEALVRLDCFLMIAKW